jgi:hypothetical protein
LEHVVVILKNHRFRRWFFCGTTGDLLHKALFVRDWKTMWDNFPYNVAGKMAHNVPAVYDVFVARIRALRSKDQGLQKCGWS